MRVISGNQKGLHLKAVPGQSTRPTSDKVKESIFNMIGPYFDGGVMLDLYGGSGSIAIEALSRGMERAVIIDHDKKAIETIYENLKKTRLADRAEVYRTDTARALKALVKKEKKFHFIFLDPPYHQHRLDKEIGYIAEYQLLESEGQLVVEHDSKVKLQEYYGDIQRVKEEKYGDTSISIFQNYNEEGL